MPIRRSRAPSGLFSVGPYVSLHAQEGYRTISLWSDNNFLMKLPVKQKNNLTIGHLFFIFKSNFNLLEKIYRTYTGNRKLLGRH